MARTVGDGDDAAVTPARRLCDNHGVSCRRLPQFVAAAAVAVTLVVAGCASAPPRLDTLAPVPPTVPGFIEGYLPREALPDSTVLLGPPPAPGSAAMALDEAVYAQTRALRGTSRWALAAADADLHFPLAANVFTCSLDAPVSDEATPNLYRLLLRSLTDALLSVSPTKKEYRRPRPFVVHHDASCTPESERSMQHDGSYPSSHAAVGWAWALILAEVDPVHATDILARGQVYAQSRVVCGVHWLSDTIAARTMAAATVARLHADPLFNAQVAAARKELAALRAQRPPPPPAHDCAAEAAATALLPPLVP
ncbi:MAG: phosphatase PAP2 family protein [Proteobacteria bacterium]|nr:phosphatase PAP2 family protein [Pseudomonadota bacterium]